jgi:dipeptidyl-peptidase-3
MFRASWAGSRIVARQVSPESASLLDELVQFYKAISPEIIIVDHEKNGEDFVNYSSLVFSNLGNYLSFGDSKFIPRISKEYFMTIIKSYSPSQEAPFNKIIDEIYSLTETNKFLGMPPTFCSQYFKGDFTKEDIDRVNNFIKKKNIEPWNTVCVKNGNHIEIKIASISNPHKDYAEMKNGILISKSHCNFSFELTHVVHHLKNALKFVSNDNQKNMIEKYIEHFSYGKIKDHKEAQKFWVKDKGPIIETNMGFIENYRDPCGMRAEFESFVSIVNKEESKKYQLLVHNAPYLLDLLPWPTDFEKEEFKKPDFTSLEVICFVGSGIPAGINIPNYDEIRESHGFKNVTLANIIEASQNSNYGSDQTLNTSDTELFKKHMKDAWAIHVAGHELLGHGSGKLIYSLDKTIINPLTSKPIETCYKDGETYASVFGSMGNSFEECKAECVGLISSTWPKMYEIFECEESFEDIMYVNWLSMIKMGFKSLSKYDKINKIWKQAHSHARFVILNILREIPNFIKLTIVNNNFQISVDRSKITTDGIRAISEQLLKMQVYKSCANVSDATKLFEKYSVITDEYLEILSILEATKTPRTQIVQPTIFMEYGEYKLKEYDSTVNDSIRSFVNNYIF